MREFAKFPVRFWARKSTKEIRNIDPHMLLVAMYLLTNTHSNMIGLYYLPLPYITHDTGLSGSAIVDIINKLKALDFCDYDENHEYVWVKDFAEDQTGLNLKTGDKRVKAIYKLLSDIPDLCFMDMFYARYEKHYHLNRQAEEFMELAEHAHRDQTGYPDLPY